MDAKFDYNPKTNKCRMSLSDKDVVDTITEHFSTPNEAKKFSKGPNSHWIPDRIHFITPFGAFDYGLTESVISWIKEHVWDRTINWEFTEAFKKKFTSDKTEYEIINNLAFQPRQYQEECVKLGMKHRFGMFVLGTGAGKTFTIASLLNNLFYHEKIKKALILVPDNGLVLQFHDELTNQYKLDRKIALFYDKINKIDAEADIIIANRPLFLSRFAQNERFFKEQVDCLVVDEAHSIKRSNEVSKKIEKMQAQYRFGFTGTLAEAKEDKMKCFGILGPVRYEKTSKELRDEGFLSNVKVHALELDYQLGKKFNANYREEIEFLQTYRKRNNFLAKLSFKLPKNSLILVNFLDHGFEMERVFNEFNETAEKKKKVYFVRGEVEVDAREEIKKLMEQEDDVVCIAITKIFSTGINIKNLHNIILCAGGKSSVTIVQSIGRGLRLHPEKKSLNIFDITDSGFKYSLRHAEKREKIYKQEKIPIEKRILKI